MAEIILHHYPVSPYSEKIRAILGYKGLTWRSVIIPTVMPKPDLVALTGGYRKTPVLQIGCDIYCDSKLIARVLDRIQPSPPLVVKGKEASCAMQEQWSEKFFMLCIPLALQPQGLAHLFGQNPQAAVEQFQKDRAALFIGGSVPRASAAASRSELPACLAALEAQLASTPFIDGAQPTLSDFSLYHSVWFVISNPGIASQFDAYPNLLAWARRIAAFGHGRSETLASAEALQRARDSRPQPDSGELSADGLQAGDVVAVAATDYGTDAVRGELLRADADEIAIRRSDERAGEVIVHFPRTGFRLAAAS